MKKGFFTFENEDGYDFLENLVINNKKIDAFFYLHGVCHEFALALNEIFGYNIILWLNYDEDIASTVLIHVFNIFEHEGKKYYADVRGITDNLKDIISEFDYIESIVDTVCYTNKKTKIILKRLGLSTEVSNDMYELINTYKSYYQIL